MGAAGCLRAGGPPADRLSRRLDGMETACLTVMHAHNLYLLKQTFSQARQASGTHQFNGAWKPLTKNMT